VDRVRATFETGDAVCIAANVPNTLEPLTDLSSTYGLRLMEKYMILGEDEFEEAISLGHLTSEQINHARRFLQELVEATGW
jgi:predicted RNA-binding protein associated with RNAse of E/G family